MSDPNARPRLPEPPAPPARRSLRSGLALAAASAVLFSAKAIVVKFTYREGADALTVVALRMGLALPVFAALAAAHVRASGRLAAADLLRLVLLGAGAYYASVYLDFAGLAFVTAGLERLLLFLHPTFVLLLSALLLGRRISRREAAALALSYVGIGLVVLHGVRGGGPDVVRGSALVLASALAYAAYLVGAGELVRRLPSSRVSAVTLTAACVAALLHLLVQRGPSGVAALANVTPAVWGLSAVNALLCTVAPVLLLAEAIARIGAPSAAQVGMVGPVVTLALGTLVLGEPFTAVQGVGAALVLSGIALISRRRVDASGVVTREATG